MRSSPAYHAVSQLKSKMKHTIKDCIDKNDNRYFIIQLPRTDTTLTIGNKIYYPTKPPHISVYENYRTAKSEVHGLSLYHLTWYGRSEETSVILHVYLDRKGQYLYCQLKDEAAKKTIEEVSPIEEAAIRRQTYQCTHEVLSTLSHHIASQWDEQNNKVNRYLSSLEKISQHIRTQFKKYAKVAKLCIKAIEEKDQWTYEHLDPRADFIRNFVKRIKTYSQAEIHTDLFQEKKSQPTTTHSLPQKNRPTPPQQHKKNRQRRKKLQTTLKAQPLTLEIKKQLEKVDKDIIAINNDKTLTDTQKAVTKHKLLHEKLEILSNAPTRAAIEYEIILWQQINKHQTFIEGLFKTSARNADLETIKILRPFIPSVDLQFFINLLFDTKNIEICEFLIQNFDECLYYTNHVLTSPSKELDAKTHAISMMLRILIMPDSLPKLKMMLRNGVHPHSQGGTEANSTEPLLLAIRLGKVACAEALLQYGANPNLTKPRSVKSNFSTLEIKNIRRAGHQLLKGKAHRSFKINAISPLIQAILQNNLEMIDLLLEYGALTTEQYEGYSAIGVATCQHDTLPNGEVVKLLVAHHADINEKQRDDSITPLAFACQRKDLDSVKLFVSKFGADPNQQLHTFGMSGSKHYVNITITPFLKAILKESSKIVKFLLEQDSTPITFATLAAAWSYFLYTSNIPMTFHPKDLSVMLIDTCNSEISTLLFNAISNINNRYDKNTIKETVKLANKNGQTYYKEKKFTSAILSFYTVLLFGSVEEKHIALYNLGCINFTAKKFKNARSYFEHCKKYDFSRGINKKAMMMLDKLEKILEKKTSSPPSCQV